MASFKHPSMQHAVGPKQSFERTVTGEPRQAVISNRARRVTPAPGTRCSASFFCILTSKPTCRGGRILPRCVEMVDFQR